MWSKENNKFWIGAGIGASVGAALVSLMGGPDSTPMPRDIDVRQPTDVGPELISQPPRIYGTNSMTSASRMRSPETFSSVSRYNFGGSNDSRVSIKDRRSPMNPYLLQKQMKSVANSDFNY